MTGIAWVVGGGSGIGAAAAHALADEGYTVVVSGRREEELRTVADALPDSAGRIVPLVVDVADSEAVEAAHAEIAATLGPVGAVVYSAGTNVANRFWSDTTPKDFARVLDVNLTGAMRVVHAVLPGMREAGDGLIVVVSSWAGWRFAPTAGAAYSTSKTALGALVESINVQERHHGIRATHLCPGEVRTEILKTRPVVPSEAEQELMLTPADLGDVVRYLASLPARVCVNELVITPTNNTSYPT